MPTDQLCNDLFQNFSRNLDKTHYFLASAFSPVLGCQVDPFIQRGNPYELVKMLPVPRAIEKHHQLRRMLSLTAEPPASSFWCTTSHLYFMSLFLSLPICHLADFPNPQIEG